MYYEEWMYSHECMVCHYNKIFNLNFRFQTKVCDGYYDLIQSATSFNEVSIASMKENDCKTYFWNMNKDEVINFEWKNGLVYKYIYIYIYI